MKFTKTEKLLLEEMEQAKKDYTESVKEYGEENGLSKFSMVHILYCFLFVKS